MSIGGTLGVPAHGGGLIVVRPELTVGVVRAVSRPTGLEIELLARRPLDRRSATERQADIRAGRPAPQPAPRRLLPRHDEGLDLRVGWLDPGGRAHWEFSRSCAWSSGDHAGGSHGPSLRGGYQLPPMFDQARLVFAWPEIGFPETVVELPLPDRATVERDTVGIRHAPLHTKPPPAALHHRVHGAPLDEAAVEAGRIVATDRVLSRGDRAAVVLTRVTAVGPAGSIEIVSVVDGRRAQALVAGIDRLPSTDLPADPARLRARGPGASVAVVRDSDAAWLVPHSATAEGGAEGFRSTTEYLLEGLDGDTLTLLVAWPAAGLADVCVDVSLSGR